MSHPSTPLPTAESHPAPDADQQLKRGLKARHLNMIAIGGAIGTGLFVASGASISSAGPGGALVAYAAIGLMVFFLMQSLGEMATYIPVSGSFETYGSRFISPSFGFALGWNYWYNWAITVATELVAAALVMKYWFPTVPGWIWSLGFLVLLVGLNFLSARAYGEAEFWFASIKVVVVVIFLIVGVLMIAGILGGHSPGLSNWVAADGDKQAPFPGGFLAIIAVFMIAGFSFQGTELVGIAAGESEDPEKNIPKAIKSVFFRILLFYIGAIAIIGFLIPFNDQNLLNGSVDNIAISPFTLVFQRAGFAAAAAVMNAVILTSILSAGNSGLYASTRMLYAMAIEHKAPAIFGKVNSRGIPHWALAGTTAIALFGFILSLISENGAYIWLVNASGMAGFIAWVGIAWCHYNFRRAFVKQGHSLSELPYRATLFPLGPIIALVLCVVVILGQNYSAFSGGFTKDAFLSFLASYIGLPLFLGLWLVHKLVTGSTPVDLAHADLSRGDLDCPGPNQSGPDAEELLAERN